MKVNLEANRNILNGYVNVVSSPVDTAKLPAEIQVVAGRFHDLDPVIQNQSVNEMLFSVPLNVVPNTMLGQVLEHWHKKLNSGGVLKFHFFDVRKIGLKAWEGESLENLHRLLLGTSEYQFGSVIDQYKLVELIRDIGFKVDLIAPKDDTYIEAIKV